MTIKELIEQLKKFDENLLIIVAGEEYSTPCPYIEQFNFKTSYWNEELKIETIPENTKFVKL